MKVKVIFPKLLSIEMTQTEMREKKIKYPFFPPTIEPSISNFPSNKILMKIYLVYLVGPPGCRGISPPPQ